MKSGRDLYFDQRGNRSSGLATYRMLVLEQGESNAAVTVEIVTSIWPFVIPLFDPGDLWSLYMFQQLSPAFGVSPV